MNLEMEKLLFPHEEIEVIDEATMMAMGQSFNWGNTIVKSEVAWSKTKGSGVNVCVVDTGCSLEHTDLKENIIGAFDAHGNNPEAIHPHGAHVSGIIAARHNDFGVVGIAPEAKLLIAKGLNDKSWGNFNTISRSIAWGVKNGAHIVNLSLGSNNPPHQLSLDVIRWATKNNVIIVAASGNDVTAKKEGRQVRPTAWPARFDEVIAVAAVNPDATMAHFSQVDSKVDIAAPGVDMYSTWENGGYGRMSGTSQACPVISGVIALLKSYYKDEIKNTKDAMQKLNEMSQQHRLVINEDLTIGIPVFDEATMLSTENEAAYKLLDQVNPEDPEEWQKVLNLYK